MAIDSQVYKELRIVPVRFERATTGDPDITMPDLDDRGHNTKVPTVNGLGTSKELRGPVVGLLQAQTIKLRLVRELIDPAAPLYLVSSNESVVTVETPAKGTPVPDGAQSDIEIKGKAFTGSTPKSAEIQVRFQSERGPIIYALNVYVFGSRTLALTPHLVTIDDPAGGGGTAPAVNLADVMAQVSAIWACCGVKFQVQPTRSWSIKLPTVDVMRWPDDVNAVTKKNFASGTMNVYFLRRIDDSCGLGLSREFIKTDPWAKANHLKKPGVFLAERCGGGARSTYWWANDLAHEIGHFLTLWHPSDGSTAGTEPSTGWPWARYETWSMRFLMHNWNQTRRQKGIPPWTDHQDFGYGANNRGALIPFKEVRSSAGAGRDAQCSHVRNYFDKGKKIY